MALCALHVNLVIINVDLHGARVKRRRAWVCRSSLTAPVATAAPPAAVTANLRDPTFFTTLLINITMPPINALQVLQRPL